MLQPIAEKLKSTYSKQSIIVSGYFLNGFIVVVDGFVYADLSGEFKSNVHLFKYYSYINHSVEFRTNIYPEQNNI